MSDNITVTGNIAADPEHRLTGGGVPVTTFRVASSQRRFDSGKGQWVETGTNWYQVSAFRGLATHAYASLHRGERVIVTGRLRLRRWETPAGKGLSVEIDADGIGHDLLWGTSQYSRATREQDSWSPPPAATRGDAEPAAGDESVRHWPTAVPGAAGDTAGDGAAAARPGDWGAPAQEQGVGDRRDAAPSGGTDGQDGTGAPDAGDASTRELQDVPF